MSRSKQWVAWLIAPPGKPGRRIHARVRLWNNDDGKGKTVGATIIFDRPKRKKRKAKP